MPVTPQERRRHAKHLAFQIVAQLPEEPQEAVMVLDYARKLILQPMEDEDTVVALKVVEG